VGKPEGKKQFRIPRRRWEDNIKMSLQEICFKGANWIYLCQDRYSWQVVMNAMMNHRVP
jgi:hypothetical protein